MRRKYTAGLVAILSIAGCSESQLDYRNAQVSNGLIYAGSENKPFSGLVTNVPESFIRSSNGYTDLLFNLNQTLKNLKSDKNIYIGRSFICDAGVKDGYISGSVSCYQTRSRTLRYTAQYKMGNMDGDMQIFAIDGKTVLAKTSFKDDLLHGASSIWSPNTGKLVSLRNTKNGKAEGAQENYDENSGKTTYTSEAKDGLTIGKAEYFNAQGKKTSQIPYDDGVPHGVANEWDTNTGKMTKLVTFEHGAKTGESKEWTPDGTLVSYYIYERNVIVEDKLRPVQASTSSVAVSSEKCLDNFIDSFHKANGDDTPIMADQIGEWESTCANNSQATWVE